MQNHVLSSKLTLSLFALILTTSVSAFAGDKEVTDGLEGAKTLFDQRNGASMAPIQTMLNNLSKIENKADNPDLNYDVFIMESRALYWEGQHAKTKEDQIRIFEMGIEKALKAKAINDSYTEAYYYAGIHLARWGESKGVLESLNRKGELETYMKEAMNRGTRDDQAGETIDGYGPDRVFGRLYYKLPGIFGGSHSESLKYLSKAYTMAKNNFLNGLYYAETLKSGNASEKALAKKVLDEVLAQNPQTTNIDRIPENAEEFEEAKKMRAGLN